MELGFFFIAQDEKGIESDEEVPLVVHRSNLRGTIGYILSCSTVNTSTSDVSF